MSKVVSTIGIVLGLFAVFFTIFYLGAVIVRIMCTHFFYNVRYCGFPYVIYFANASVLLYPITLYMLLKKFGII